MALFSSNLKKMQHELDNSFIDWNRLASLSSGKYDLSGKNYEDGRKLVISLIQRASEGLDDGTELTKIIRNIHSKGGDFNRPLNEKGGTAIHVAAEQQSSVLLKALLDAGIPPAATTSSGATPLHRAVYAGSPDNVRLLLSAGADPGAEDNMSNSPLHIAAMHNDTTEITKLLLSSGAKAYHRNSDKKRPADLAMDRQFQKCVELLAESLRNLRRTRHIQWKCPKCSNPIKRPPAEKISWYLNLEMWEHLRFTCGNCGNVSTALCLDGEI
ncbi:hypothetical protein CSA37_08115 [Candidatus Fermentibacteria bacterium]|nr:MAG: hypothetical protein CSA37_08115 [Candidatus Fermentibacteria bacterium]